MKIPEKLWVITDASSVASNIAYMAPYETNAQGKKRQETGRKYFRHGNERTIDNTPVTGIELATVQSQYSTSNKSFLVSDPRGFDLELTAENFFKLTNNVIIDHGKITTPCVWAAEGGHALVAVGSDVYNAAITKQKEPSPKKISPNSLNIGDIVSCNKDDCRWVFLGKWSYCVQGVAVKSGYSYSTSADQDWELIIPTSGYMFIPEKALTLPVNVMVKQIDFWKSIPFTKVHENSGVTLTEVNAMIPNLETTTLYYDQLFKTCIAMLQQSVNSDANGPSTRIRGKSSIRKKNFTYIGK